MFKMFGFVFLFIFLFPNEEKKESFDRDRVDEHVITNSVSSHGPKKKTRILLDWRLWMARCSVKLAILK